MTDQDWQDLGRRAVACKGWRWMPGMLEIGGVRSNGEQYDGSVWVDHCGGGYEPIAGWVPDLRDPATLGCLLALVREGWGKPLLYVEPEEDEIDGLAWYVWCASEAQSYSRGLHRSEAHALVDALESAL